MTTEEGTLWSWVRMQPKFVFINEMMFDLEYKGVMCRGVKTICPYTEELRIMPFSHHHNITDSTEDEGYKGASVFKSFKRNILTPNSSTIKDA